MTKPDADPRERLLDAFVDALLLGPYDKITVEFLLARAGVGRTTFYAHFRSKDDLLAHSVGRLHQSLAAQAQQAGGSLAFVRPYLSHVLGHQLIYQAFAGREAMQTLEWHQRRMLEALFEADPAWVKTASPTQRAVCRAAAVGALWGAVQAWLERRLPISPEVLTDEMEALVRRLAPVPLEPPSPTASSPKP